MASTHVFKSHNDKNIQIAIKENFGWEDEKLALTQVAIDIYTPSSPWGNLSRDGENKEGRASRRHNHKNHKLHQDCKIFLAEATIQPLEKRHHLA